MLSILDFLFKDSVQDIIGEINGKFNSKYGNKAYNRGMLLCVLSYDEIGRYCANGEI